MDKPGMEAGRVLTASLDRGDIRTIFRAFQITRDK